jgi:hypothetical protein
MDQTATGGAALAAEPVAWSLDDWSYIPAHYAYFSAMLVKPGLMQFVATTTITKVADKCTFPSCFREQYFPSLSNNAVVKLQVKIPLFGTAAACSGTAQMSASTAGMSGSSSNRSVYGSGSSVYMWHMPDMTVYNEVNAVYSSTGSHLKHLSKCLQDFQGWRKVFFEKVSCCCLVPNHPEVSWKLYER